MFVNALDPELVTAVQRGDPFARERLLDVVLPTVLQWCSRLGGPRIDAEDAAHDVCVVVLRSIGKVEEPDRFPSWLFGVTRRVLAQHRRKAWLRRWVGAPSRDVVDPGADPRRAAERSQTARRVQAALEELPEVQRVALVLFELEERTETEVAELLDIPIGTARSRVRTARERFRRAARRHHIEGEVIEFARGERP